MKKLIVIHEQKEQVIHDVMMVYSHHIACPNLFRLVKMEGKDDPSEEEFVGVLNSSLDNIFEQASCGVMVITNDQGFIDKFDYLRKHFNTFNVFTDHLKFAKYRDEQGVWISSRDDILYMFSQLVTWLFAVEAENVH